MAKEIGNWGKPAAAPPSAQIAGASNPATAKDLVARRLKPDEHVLWASYGSGTRPGIHVWIAGVGTFIAGFAAVQWLLNIEGMPPWLMAPLGIFSWVVYAFPAYAVYRTRFGPQLETYAVTNRRAIVLQLQFPFTTTTCSIRQLKIDGAERDGSILFGRNIRMRVAPWGLFWDLNGPMPGFYGIAKPVEVAQLISSTVAPDVKPDAPIASRA